MNPEDENIAERRPELAAVEAALAQLRPRREARFADALKGRLKDALSNKTPATENVTATVRVPLTHYIRIAQFNAAVGGLLAGLFLGVLLGGSVVFFTLSRLEPESSQPARRVHAASVPYVRMLLDDRASLSPVERAFLRELDQELSHGRE